MTSTAQGRPSSGRRLGILLLGYLLVAVAAIVLAPFEFTWPRMGEWSLAGPTGPGFADLVLNVVLFVPLGFLAERLGGGRWGPGRITVAAAALSVAIETTQLFIPGRWSAIADVTANIAGGGLGALVSTRLRRGAGGDVPLLGRLFLELPLVGFLWLMVPMLWLNALAAGDKATMIAAAAGAGVALAAALSSSPALGHTGPLRAAGLGMGWSAVSLAPLALVEWRTATAAALATIVAAILAEPRFRRLTASDRRVEPRAVVLVIVLLLPLFVASTMPGLVPGLGAEPGVGRQGILRWLAGLAAFTLLGYLMAEWRGRAARRWPDTAIAPMLAAALVTPLADPGAGIAGRLAPAILAAGFGALLFELQREHVIALRRRFARDPDRPEVTNLAPDG